MRPDTLEDRVNAVEEQVILRAIGVVAEGGREQRQAGYPFVRESGRMLLFFLFLSLKRRPDVLYLYFVQLRLQGPAHFGGDVGKRGNDAFRQP